VASDREFGVFEGFVNNSHASYQSLFDEVETVSKDPSFQDETHSLDNFLITSSSNGDIPQEVLQTFASSDGGIVTGVPISHQTLDDAIFVVNGTNTVDDSLDNSQQEVEINSVDAIEPPNNLVDEKANLTTNLTQAGIENGGAEIKIIKTTNQNQQNPSLDTTKIQEPRNTQSTQETLFLYLESSTSNNVQVQPTTSVVSSSNSDSSFEASFFSPGLGTSSPIDDLRFNKDPLSKIVADAGIPQDTLDTFASSDGEIITGVFTTNHTVDEEFEHYLNPPNSVDAIEPQNNVDKKKAKQKTNIGNHVAKSKIIKTTKLNKKNLSLDKVKIQKCHNSQFNEGAQYLNLESATSCNTQAQPTTSVDSSSISDSSSETSPYSSEPGTSFSIEDFKREKNNQKCRDFRKRK